MKKVLAVAAAVCVMCMAGTALARTDAGNSRRMMPRQRMERPVTPDMPAGFESPDIARGPRYFPIPRPGKDAPKTPCGPRFGQRTFTPDMPQEIREKAAELAKLRIDLEEAMTSRPVNREKALEVYAKIQKVKQDIETWRLTQRLDRIEARQKQGLSPAPEDVDPSAGEETETPEE